MRKALIAGNWKMHGSKQQAEALVQALVAANLPQVIDVVVCPSFLHLALVHELIRNTNINLGAQNLYPGSQGAYTGEVAADMLVDIGCKYVLVGHSERRILLNETLDIVAKKFKAAVDAGLMPILCIGETEQERAQQQTEAVIQQQLQSVIDFAGIEAFKKAVLAYEPVWAIGTGLTATPAQAQQVHALIRQQLAQNNVAIGETIRILYGGSMKPENAQALLSMQDIDGGLIGGASLKADQFLSICTAALQKNTAKQKSA